MLVLSVVNGSTPPTGKVCMHPVLSYTKDISPDLCRERLQGLERQSRRLPSPPHGRISGPGVPGPQPVLPTPPATGSSRRLQPALAVGPALQSGNTTSRLTARPIGQRARRERERQQGLSSASDNTPPTSALPTPPATG